MGSYRLSEDAKADLIRIYGRGLREHGELQADAYYGAFFDRFEQIAKQPLLYAGVEHVRVEGDDVEIMAIIGQQDIGQWLSLPEK